MGLKIQEKRVVRATEEFVRNYFESESSGHDWWHIYRVRNLALKIAKREGGDLFLIEMAALLHDLDDWKLNEGSEESKIKKWLTSIGFSEEKTTEIIHIVGQVSFKGAGVETRATSIEAQIVQDADRLDAIGAIGIARTFAYGGNRGRLIHHPDSKPEMHSSFEEYKKTTAPTINHFYEKLLLLKNRMNTETAKKMAEKRHRFMEVFLKQFFEEWESKI